LIAFKPVIYLGNLSEEEYTRKKNKWLTPIHDWACSNAFFPWFMPIPNKCIGAKDTLVQKGDYRDMRSSVIVSITWHLVTIRIFY